MDYFYKMNPGNKTCPSDFKYWLQDIATDSFMFRNSLSLFKKLFNQLGHTIKERKIATEALVSIASGAGMECLSKRSQMTEPFYRNQVKSLLAMKIWRWGTQTTRGRFT